MVLRRGRQVSHGAAQPHQPPAFARRRPGASDGAGSQSRSPSVSRTRSLTRSSSFFLAGPGPGRSSSVRITAPSGNETRSRARRSATRISCRLPPPISSTTPSVIVEVLIAAT